MPSAMATSPVTTFGRISACNHSEPTARMTLATIIDVDTA
jgi:hypothetical protein